MSKPLLSLKKNEALYDMFSKVDKATKFSNKNKQASSVGKLFLKSAQVQINPQPK